VRVNIIWLDGVVFSSETRQNFFGTDVELFALMWGSKTNDDRTYSETCVAIDTCENFLRTAELAYEVFLDGSGWFFVVILQETASLTPRRIAVQIDIDSEIEALLDLLGIPTYSFSRHDDLFPALPIDIQSGDVSNPGVTESGDTS
jgi:hypothetical protein